MIVVSKDSNNKSTYEVYDIIYDKNGYPHFLIYNNRKWLRLSAKHFKPLEEYEKVEF